MILALLGTSSISERMPRGYFASRLCRAGFDQQCKHASRCQMGLNLSARTS